MIHKTYDRLADWVYNDGNFGRGSFTLVALLAVGFFAGLILSALVGIALIALAATVWVAGVHGINRAYSSDSIGPECAKSVTQ